MKHLFRNRPSVLLASGICYAALIIWLQSMSWLPRFDLTASKNYTLAPGSHAIAEKINKPLLLRLVFSKSAAKEYPQISAYYQRVQELISEFTKASPDRLLRLEIVHPQTFSVEEEEAESAGLNSVAMPDGSNLFFGLYALNATGVTPITFFQPERERFLEYEIARLIDSAHRGARKEQVGLINTLRPAASASMSSVNSFEGVMTEVRKRFVLVDLGLSVAQVDPEIDVLWVIQPQGLDEQSLYAVEQFVLGGGRAMIMMDPLPETDTGLSSYGNINYRLQQMLEAWGVRFSDSQLLLDARYAVSVSNGRGGSSPLLSLVGLDRSALSQQDPVSAELETINMSSAGVLLPISNSTTSVSTLIQSSQGSSLIEISQFLNAYGDAEALLADFLPDRISRALAVRVQGMAKSVFPIQKEAHLAKSERNLNVVLVADTDFLNDQLWMEQRAFLGRSVVSPFSNNADLVVNALENLAGSSDLIGLRTRGVSSRPFTLVERLRRRAQAEYREKELSLEQELDDLQDALIKLESERDAASDKATEIEAEQRIDQFKQRRLELRREIRAVQFGLNQEIELLGRNLKLFFILGLPLLVAIAALVIGTAYRRRRSRLIAKSQ